MSNDEHTTLPKSYEEMVREISAQHDSLSKRLKQIARYALDNPNDFALKTIAEIAKKAEVQPSALVRFAKAFGFSGFTDVQRLFQQRLLESRPSYDNRLQHLRESSDNTPLDLLKKFAVANTIALEHLVEEMPEEKLKEAIRILSDAETIHVLGMRRSFPLASMFYYSVTKMGHRAHLIDNVGGMHVEQQTNVGPRDALIAFSFSGYTPYVTSAAEKTHHGGIPVVAITDHLLSPLTHCSTVCFHVEDGAVHDFKSLGASMCLVQALVVGLGAVETD
ncbi:MAG: MurR/RpiR family transcriptional regulator [Sneathiella sp.]|nr:MurR/RpiR family transcriptional regulator [Sneathiella sp.]